MSLGHPVRAACARLSGGLLPRILGLGLALLVLAPAGAAAQKIVSQVERVISVSKGSSVLLVNPLAISRFSVGDPNIAEAIVLSPTEVLINGKGLGTTTLLVWDNSGQVRVNDVSGVSGFVTVNTRVDVLFTIDDKVNTTEPSTRIIMQDVRAIAAGQQIQPDKDGKPVSVGVVTFLLTPEQAETLALASQQGSIQLALRNSMDTMRVKTFGTKVSALLGGTIGRPLPPRRPATRSTAAPVAAAAPQPSQTVIEVYRGGARTLQKF